MEKKEFVQKYPGDNLKAKEWNSLIECVNEIVDEVNSNADIISSNDENNVEIKSDEDIVIRSNGENELGKVKLAHNETEFASFSPGETSLNSDKYSFKKNGIIDLSDEENPSTTWEDVINIIKTIKDSLFTYEQVMDIVDKVYSIWNTSNTSKEIIEQLVPYFTIENYLKLHLEDVLNLVEKVTTSQWELDDNSEYVLLDASYIKSSDFDHYNTLEEKFRIGFSELYSILEDYLEEIDDEDLTLSGNQIDPDILFETIKLLPGELNIAIKCTNNYIWKFKKYLGDIRFYDRNNGHSITYNNTLLLSLRKLMEISKYPWEDILNIINTIKNSNNLTLKENQIFLEDYLVSGIKINPYNDNEDYTYSMSIPEFEALGLYGNYFNDRPFFIVNLESIQSNQVTFPLSFKSSELFTIFSGILEYFRLNYIIKNINLMEFDGIVIFKFSDIAVFYRNYTHNRGLNIATHSEKPVYLSDIANITYKYKNYYNYFFKNIHLLTGDLVSTKISLEDKFEIGSIYTLDRFNSNYSNNAIFMNLIYDVYDVGYACIDDFDDSDRKFSSIIDEFRHYNFDLEDDEFELEPGLVNPLTMVSNLTTILESRTKCKFVLKCLDGYNNIICAVINYIPGDMFIENASIGDNILLSDIIKLVNYMKTNNQGPWAAS